MIFFVYICWFLCKNLSYFVPSVWKLHNPYCHKLIISLGRCLIRGVWGALVPLPSWNLGTKKRKGKSITISHPWIQNPNGAFICLCSVYHLRSQSESIRLKSISDMYFIRKYFKVCTDEAKRITPNHYQFVRGKKPGGKFVFALGETNKSVLN